MRGDIDGDGKITENDRNRISEHLGGTITLTGADSWCAKVTGNNEISVSDLVQLMQYLEGKTNNLTGIPTFADYYNNWTYHKVDDLTGYWTAEVVINGLKTTSDAIVNISNDEGIFYKSELSDGAISFYATRPPIAEVPATITFKPGTGVITTSYESAKFHAATHSKDGADPIIPESIGALSLSGGTMTGSLILRIILRKIQKLQLSNMQIIILLIQYFIRRRRSVTTRKSRPGRISMLPQMGLGWETQVNYLPRKIILMR